MLKISTLAAAAAFVAGGLALQVTAASAMPALDAHVAQAVQENDASGVQQARVICGPYRCFYRPRPYGYDGYRRPFFGGYGYHRHFGGYGPGYGYRRHFGGYGPGYGFHRGYY